MRKQILRGVGLALSALLVVVFALLPLKPTQAENSRVITVYFDGKEQTVVTDAPTIGEVLERAEIPVSESDLVEPGLKTQLTTPTYNVNIYRARPVTIVDGDMRVTINTPQSSAQKITKDAGINLHDEDLTEMSRINDFLAEDGVGLKLTIDRATLVNINLYGSPQQMRTQAATVGDLLKEKEIILGEKDGANLALDVPITADMQLNIWRDGVQTVTVEEDVAFGTELVRDTDKPLGYREVSQPGQKGKKLVTYEVEMRGGQEFARKQVQSVTTQQPQNQIEVVGGVNFANNQELLQALRNCEAGGRYDRNSGNGYYGAYQFSLSTWNRVAPKVGRPDLVGVRPDLAAPADQDFMVIANAKLSSGGFATQHPGCYKKLNMPVKPY